MVLCLKAPYANLYYALKLKFRLCSIMAACTMYEGTLRHYALLPAILVSCCVILDKLVKNSKPYSTLAIKYLSGLKLARYDCIPPCST